MAGLRPDTLLLSLATSRSPACRGPEEEARVKEVYLSRQFVLFHPVRTKRRLVLWKEDVVTRWTPAVWRLSVADPKPVAQFDVPGSSFGLSHRNPVYKFPKSRCEYREVACRLSRFLRLVLDAFAGT